MGANVVRLTKTANSVPVATYINGDQNTAMLKLEIERYANGVDLSELGFAVLVSNADEKQAALPVVVSDTTDSKLTIDWVIPQIVGDAAGLCEFAVIAVDANAEQLWQSSVRTIKIAEKFEVTPDYEEHTLSEFERVLTECTVEMGQMRQTMSEFEGRIDAAVDKAEGIYETVKEAYESGEFKGEKGDKGDPPKHTWNGTVLTITSASGTSSSDLKGEKGDDGDEGFSPTVISGKHNGVTTVIITSKKSQNVLTIRDGVDGKTPVKGVDYRDGVDGKTPVKGTDYYTPAERAEMVDAVKAGVQPSITEINKALDVNNEALSHLGDVVDDKADKTELANKVGYSEVVNGQLLMYSDSTKEKLLATMDLPTSTPTDVQINGTSITENGVANIPYADIGVEGIIRGAAWETGIRYDNGAPYVYGADKTFIDLKLNQYRPINPKYLDYAIRAGLISNAEIKDADKPLICETLGAEPKKSDWVLKGTMNNVSSIDVDLNGCTEIMIIGDGNASANMNLETNICNLIYGTFRTGNTRRFAWFQDVGLGIVPLINGYATSRTAYNFTNADLGNAYNCIGKHISDITRFSINLVSTYDFNLEIYAR